MLIQKASCADTIVDMQQKIAKIKTSSIQVLRIVILQLPFWTTWYLSVEMLKEPELLYWVVNLTVSGTFVFFSIWLFHNLSLNNMHKKWMKWLFSDTEWNAVIKAENVLKQIEEYKNC